ncbi:TPA: restriction endonuclease subunit S [Vibrio vulnificus]|nr:MULTISPECIES: restriction endonuclease subunit S [Vibrio]EJR4266285.1 restriction endonuclease subunit S [Vibrio vulnificus]ELQ3740305.1 restriction endonuclease subunit S [Vibrio vulnificus]ELS5837709.1 restriction endonuclease subunit S [Vibrio vulnificus]MCA0782986.1 restriction endonuclease subunit S [Vibrio vulnificus]TOD06366.1 restriction endonuclease subunit S [Vibrio parahaemolyticus]
MTGRYKAYPEYKDSTIDWVGDIPSSWVVKPTFSVFDPSVNKNTDGRETTVLSLSYGNIVERNVETNFGLLPESFSTYQIVDNGDLILRLTDLQNDKKSLRVGLVKQKGVITSAYLKLGVTKSIEPRFAYRLLHSYDTTKVFYGMGGGLRQSMKFEDFRRLPIVLPSYEEQQKIANFLDHETAKIDTLIAKQEKLIELLKEKRQAVISHAVTKGLNPDVPMKDSGVEWLGDVPEHWVVTSIKRELKSLDSRRIPLSADERGKRTGEYRYYGASGVIDFIDDYIFDEPTVLVGEDGANLLNRNTPLAFSAHGQYWVNNHAHILSPLDGLVDYWAEVIEIIDVTPIVSGSAQPKLTAEALNNLKISFPASLEERQTIEKFICIQQSKYDQLMRKAKNQVELLKERKTALISAAVTGKIDVRDWQEPTYQESA